MKKPKQLLVTCMLALSSLLVQAQTDSIDISTGRNASGAKIGSLGFDDDWKVLVPGSSTFQQVQVGTGRRENDGRQFQNLGIDRSILAPGPTPLTYTIGWLTPYPYVTDNPSTTGVVGDMLPVSSAGSYYYRIPINLSYGICKQVTDARLHLKLLTALSEVQEIYINDSPAYLPPVPEHNADSAYKHINNVSEDYWNSVITEEVVVLDPSHFHSGLNYIIVKVSNNTAHHTGFMCEGNLQYTIGDHDINVPLVDITGTTEVACTGSPVTINVNISAPGGFIYKAFVFDNNTLISNSNISPNNGTLFYTSVAFQTYAAANSDYSLMVVNSQTGCETNVDLDMAICSEKPHFKQRFQYRIANPDQYNVITTPRDITEITVPGFTNKWILQELDPSNMAVLYTIDNPPTWDSHPNSFLGFHGEDPSAYMAAVRVTELPEKDAPGIFVNNHLYAITRMVKDNYTDWQSYTVYIRDGKIVEGLGKRDLFENAGKAREAEKTASSFSVYPNPGTGVFIINTQATGPIHIYDALGKHVKQIDTYSGTNVYTVDLSSFPKGVYMMNVSQPEGKTITKKLIIE